MTVVLAVLVGLLLITIIAFIAFVANGVAEVEREERARVEHEARRAEYQLHHLASNAFAHMMNVAREHGFRSEQ